MNKKKNGKIYKIFNNETEIPRGVDTEDVSFSRQFDLPEKT